MSRRKKILPAGISLHANDSLLMMDSNSHFVHFSSSHSDLCSRDCSEWIRSCLHSSEMLTVIVVVPIMIPRNVRCVVGPSIFEGFTGALRLLHTASIVERLLAHSCTCCEKIIEVVQEMADSIILLQNPVQCI